MVQIISWIATFGICFLVFRHSNAPVAVLGIYYLLALLLRWWLVKRIAKISKLNKKIIQDFMQMQDTAHRRMSLMEKYNDHQIVELIMNRQIWKGASSTMLIDSMGKPDKTDQDGDSEIWCYGKVGKNRYRNRITLRNDMVKSWTAKN